MNYQNDINELIEIWENAAAKRCPFCNGDSGAIEVCCDEANYEWDVEATAALCVEVMDG